MRFVPWSLVAAYAQFHLAAGVPRGDLGTVSSEGLLLSRQFEDPDVIVNNHCKNVCTTSTCGFGTCPLGRRDDAQPTTPRTARRFRRVDSYGTYTHINTTNGTDNEHGTFGPLSKRVFQVPLNAQTSTVTDIANYMRRQYEYEQVGGGFVGPDPQFGADIAGFFLDGDEDDKTVSYQERFQDFAGRPFQWGTNGLHGCTMVTIVSGRAAWMAHIWEMGGMCGFDDFRRHAPGIDCSALWQAEVIGPIFNAARPGISVNVDWSLFNQPGDNTRVIIMTPMYGDEDNDEPWALFRTMMYERKIELLVDEFQKPGRLVQPQVVVYEYDALNYDPLQPRSQDTPLQSLDRHFAENTQFGHCLFQYDGAGNWRLFYEDSLYHN